MKLNSRCICKKCYNDFISTISANTKSIKCSKCKSKYNISSLSELIINLNKELLKLNDKFHTIYIYHRIEIEQDYKLSISNKYSSTDAFINDTIKIIKDDQDIDLFPIPRLDIVAYNFIQGSFNNDLTLHIDDIDPKMYRFVKNNMLTIPFKETLNFKDKKVFSIGTKFENTKLSLFSDISNITNLYNLTYGKFSRENPLVFYPYFLY